MLQIPANIRRIVKEITLDMAPNMKLIAQTSIAKATQVLDRFHVQKLAIEAFQEARIKHRWEAIDQENEAVLVAKKKRDNYIPETLLTGDTRKQFLARSRYLLYKSPRKWTVKQQLRAQVLFKECPEIKQAYNLSQKLREFFNTKQGKGVALTKLAHWYKDVEESNLKSFATIMNTVKINYDKTILQWSLNFYSIKKRRPKLISFFL